MQRRDAEDTNIMKVIKVNFVEGLTSARHLFDASDRADGGLGWFRTLALTTLEPQEQAVLALLLTDAGEARAALPLAQHSNGALRALTAPYTCRYSAPFGTPEDAEALGRGLRGIVPGRLHLDALDPDDPALDSFTRGVRGGGLLSAGYTHFANWHDTISSFDDFWSRRPSALRQLVRRKTRRLEREGRLDFRCLSNPKDLVAGAETYERIYASSWKVPEPHPRFMPQLLQALGAEGKLRLGLALIDGAAVAVQIWLVHGRRATIFKLAHLPGHETHSPGTLLSHWLLSKLVETEGVEEVDFGRGDDAYKAQWLSSSRPRTGLIIANPASLDGLACTIRHIWPMRLRAALRHPPASGQTRHGSAGHEESL